MIYHVCYYTPAVVVVTTAVKYTIKAVLIQRTFMQSNKTEMETEKIKLNAVSAALNISAYLSINENIKIKNASSSFTGIVCPSIYTFNYKIYLPATYGKRHKDTENSYHYYTTAIIRLNVISYRGRRLDRFLESRSIHYIVL